MARYTGPTFRKSRRYGFSILETGKEFAKGKQRTTAPGVHGATKKKHSDYGLHLLAKQQVRYTYGVNERQFENTFDKASKMKDVTAGIAFLLMLESRLDNLVYRFGWAATRAAARQLVSHGHIMVNGKKADIASMQIKVGSTVSIKPASQNIEAIKTAMASKPAAPWLTRDNVKPFEGVYSRFPERSELNPEFKENLIVEFYSK